MGSRVLSFGIITYEQWISQQANTSTAEGSVIREWSFEICPVHRRYRAVWLQMHIIMHIIK